MAPALSGHVSVDVEPRVTAFRDAATDRFRCRRRSGGLNASSGGRQAGSPDVAVRHSGLTSEQSNALETVQRRAACQIIVVCMYVCMYVEMFMFAQQLKAKFHYAS